jgi:hypothetical protein
MAARVRFVPNQGVQARWVDPYGRLSKEADDSGCSVTQMADGTPIWWHGVVLGPGDKEGTYRVKYTVDGDVHPRVPADKIRTGLYKAGDGVQCRWCTDDGTVDGEWEADTAKDEGVTVPAEGFWYDARIVGPGDDKVDPHNWHVRYDDGVEHVRTPAR